MRVTITKMWYTECEVEIPDERKTDKLYLANLADAHLNDPADASWDGTIINVTDGDEELASW